MLVTEPHPDVVEIVRQAIAGGVNVVQWRERPLTPERDQELYYLGAAMREASHGALLLVNGPRAILKADGWHLRSVISYNSATRMIAQHKLVGQSVHSVSEALVSAQSGYEYLIAGTIFASQSHPDVAPQGLSFLRDLCAAVTIPVIAIGGVTPARVADCVAAGAAGVAALSPIMRAADPQAAAREYRQALDAAWKAIPCT